MFELNVFLLFQLIDPFLTVPEQETQFLTNNFSYDSLVMGQTFSHFFYLMRTYVYFIFLSLEIMPFGTKPKVNGLTSLSRYNII